MSDLNDLKMLLESRYPIVVIETWEELRALDLIRRLGMREGRPVFAWNVVDGLRRLEFEDAPSQKHTVEPDALLGQIRGTNEPGIYALCDLHPFLKDEPRHTRLLKEIALHQLHAWLGKAVEIQVGLVIEVGFLDRVRNASGVLNRDWLQLGGHDQEPTNERLLCVCSRLPMNVCRPRRN